MTMTDNKQLETPTTLDSLDSAQWLHISETVKLLLLSIAQIELTLTDGEHNVTGLGSLFTDMAEQLREVNAWLETQEDTPAEICDHGRHLAGKVNEGIVAFQFYDRLSQRLNHVVTGLALTEEVLRDEHSRTSEHAWKMLQRTIKSTYSLDCERKMFDLVLQGMPLHEALSQYQDEHLKQNNNDIELF
ncbi:hypothetical protein [Shewanella algae]|uniref:hypothetical protein n=2 Tax=Shewanella algae TaxID=38313 RepID=UPI0005ED17F3|nr:hypothetical protein [Shewanella algae]MBO2558638.1 hypothetical protein [Shewanella algae]MBO2567103.1 hypothetical protein [Shewanella algae]MBO2575574.1 hypothetical protein [Shewanella algae]MBO2579940.1 hypothetical protein [Shewanella algae]MBO2584366.1 hypothetical protein [Shewanella algae]